MDESKEYIKLCEQATELQALRRDVDDWTEGSFIYNKLSDMHEAYYYDGFAQEYIDNSVWLPRQDQLQEMLLNHDHSINLLKELFDFIDYYCDDTTLYYTILDTFEKKWLALLMNRIYNKTWNGTDWEEVINGR